ncbi:MAG: hypothetical protein AB7I49_04035 [Candidatus Nitrosocosmicus sp.]
MYKLIKNISNTGLFTYYKTLQYHTKSLAVLYVATLFITAMTISSFDKTVNYASASDFLDLNLDQNIEQFQSNLQQTIMEQVQSSINNSKFDKNYCEGNNVVNMAIQSQTNWNGQSSSIMQNYCSNLDSIRFPDKDFSLTGLISTSEYDTNLEYMLNTILGNWSLTNNPQESLNFKSFFIKSPAFYKLSGPLMKNVTQSLDSSPASQGLQNMTLEDRKQQSNAFSYNISEFTANSISLIDSHKIFQGKVNVTKQTVSNQSGEAIFTNTFNNVPISLAIFDNKTLIINFDKDSDLFNDFTNISLVGAVNRQ